MADERNLVDEEDAVKENSTKNRREKKKREKKEKKEKKAYKNFIYLTPLNIAYIKIYAKKQNIKLK